MATPTSYANASTAAPANSDHECEGEARGLGRYLVDPDSGSEVWQPRRLQQVQGAVRTRLGVNRLSA